MSVNHGQRLRSGPVVLVEWISGIGASTTTTTLETEGWLADRRGKATSSFFRALLRAPKPWLWRRGAVLGVCVLGWWVGEAALDRGGGGACLIEEGVVGSCGCWVGGGFFWGILDGWGGRLRLLLLLLGVWGLLVGVWNA